MPTRSITAERLLPIVRQRRQNAPESTGRASHAYGTDRSLVAQPPPSWRPGKGLPAIRGDARRRDHRATGAAAVVSDRVPTNPRAPTTIFRSSSLPGGAISAAMDRRRSGWCGGPKKPKSPVIERPKPCAARGRGWWIRARGFATSAPPRPPVRKSRKRRERADADQRHIVAHRTLSHQSQCLVERNFNSLGRRNAKC
jgi:hypothetical protein